MDLVSGVNTVASVITIITFLINAALFIGKAVSKYGLGPLDYLAGFALLAFGAYTVGIAGLTYAPRNAIFLDLGVGGFIALMVAAVIALVVGLATRNWGIAAALAVIIALQVANFAAPSVSILDSAALVAILALPFVITIPSLFGLSWSRG